jgi:hypothetical protein
VLAVCAGLDAAWKFFEGIPMRLVPDNMKTIVQSADASNPRLNDAFRDYTEARGLFVDPARVRHPQDKDELFGPVSKSLGTSSGTFSVPDGVIDSRREVTAFKIDLGNVNAVLVIPGRAPSLPRWAQFLQPVVPNIGAYVSRNSANSAVMLVPIDKRLFAVVFGHGRHILDAEALMRGFGACCTERAGPGHDAPRKLQEVEARTLFGELQSSQATKFHISP